VYPSHFRPDAPYYGFIETRTAADRYFWDGMRRGADPARPFVVFQVTLRGEGRYEQDGTAHPIGPGRAFAAVVPTPHRYYLPAGLEEWRFFWVLIRHPYIVRRIAERQRAGASAVLDVTPDAPLLARAVTLLEGTFPDAFAQELALFAFLTEYDRHLHRAAREAAPDDDGERLLEEVRRFVRERLDRPADVTELAARHGMSRTRFSHHFRETTGLSPARFMARVRLEEAARSLALTDDPLHTIAAATGFADANHLCKAFRRHFRTSPGAFRRQMR
jgi:AraC-like DNA-binding protein